MCVFVLFVTYELLKMINSKAYLCNFIKEFGFFFIMLYFYAKYAVLKFLLKKIIIFNNVSLEVYNLSNSFSIEINNKIQNLSI